MEYYSLGIDPGWKNLGYALVRKSIQNGVEVVRTGTLNPSENDHLALATLTELPFHMRYVTIERYVSYQGINSAESENILMFIGGMKYILSERYGEPEMVRAIDWKTELVKNLVRVKGFDNPSNSLDKKFSIAAANACLDKPGEFKNDHEADAICLACLPIYRKLAAEKRTASKDGDGNSVEGSNSSKG